VYFSGKNMKIPYSAQFEIEEGCTHKCLHCYNESPSVKRNLKSASKEIIDAVSKEDIFSIVLTGGEPLLAGPKIKYALRKFSDSNMDISINTNLYLLNRGHIESFKEFDIDGVLTSILGPNASVHDSITGVRGSFYRVLNSLEQLVSNDIKASANMVVLPQNKEFVYETGKMLMDKVGLRVFCATPVVPNYDLSINNLLTKKEYIGALDDLLALSKDHGIFTDVLHPTLPCIFDSEKQREEYQYFLKNRACGAAQSTLTISADGGVRPCSHSDKVYGNILESPLIEIIGKMGKWVNKKLTPANCDPCTYEQYCGGGCRVSSEVISGDIDGQHHYMGSPIVGKENVLRESKKMPNFHSLEKISKNLKFRKEKDGLYSVFADLESNAIVDDVGMGIVRRFSSGASYEDIVNNLDNEKKSLIDNRVEYLFNKGLLVSSSN